MVKDRSVLLLMSFIVLGIFVALVSFSFVSASVVANHSVNLSSNPFNWQLNHSQNFTVFNSSLRPEIANASYVFWNVTFYSTSGGLVWNNVTGSPAALNATVYFNYTRKT